MSFYGNITNYIADTLQSGKIVTNPTGQPAGTYLALIFNTAAGTTETIYINVTELDESNTISVDDNGVLVIT